jgi:hypothetical protein
VGWGGVGSSRVAESANSSRAGYTSASAIMDWPALISYGQLLRPVPPPPLAGLFFPPPRLPLPHRLPPVDRPTRSQSISRVHVFLEPGRGTGPASGGKFAVRQTLLMSGRIFRACLCAGVIVNPASFIHSRHSETPTELEFARLTRARTFLGVAAPDSSAPHWLSFYRRVGDGGWGGNKAD